jgi:hypothetical protein
MDSATLGKELAGHERPKPTFLEGPPKQLLIDGKWVPAASGATLQTIDKADRVEAQEMLGAYEEAGADRVVSIQGLGDRMGSNEGVGWAPETFRDQLATAVERYL